MCETLVSRNIKCKNFE